MVTVQLERRRALRAARHSVNGARSEGGPAPTPAAPEARFPLSPFPLSPFPLSPFPLRLIAISCRTGGTAQMTHTHKDTRAKANTRACARQHRHIVRYTHTHTHTHTHSHSLAHSLTRTHTLTLTLTPAVGVDGSVRRVTGAGERPRHAELGDRAEARHAPQGNAQLARTRAHARTFPGTDDGAVGPGADVAGLGPPGFLGSFEPNRRRCARASRRSTPVPADPPGLCL